MSVKIDYEGTEIEIKEPSIELWNKLMSMKELSDEKEFSYLMLGEICGMSLNEIKKMHWEKMLNLSSSITNHVLQDSKKFYKEFEFEGKKYKFIDLPNLTFGEFVDIDTFLQKPANERQKEMALLMAFLYREEENGKISDYDSSKIEVRANLFKKLPIKYVNGATTFFLLTERMLRQSSPFSLKKKMMKILQTIKMLMISPVLVLFGVGLILSSSLRTRTLLRLNKSLNIP